MLSWNKKLRGGFLMRREPETVSKTVEGAVEVWVRVRSVAVHSCPHDHLLIWAK